MESRTGEQTRAFTAAAAKGRSLEKLISQALSDGVLNKPGTKEEYSLSWVIGRLRKDDSKIADKLVEYANTL